MGPYLITAIKDVNDEACARFASGLISDLANYLEKKMTDYIQDFMASLTEVLTSIDYSIDTKTHAMIAVGDICLATEEEFEPYLE
jgi:hypothetical protein